MKQQFLQSNQKLLKSRRKQAIDDAVTAKKQKLIKIKKPTKEEKDAAKAKVDEEEQKLKITLTNLQRIMMSIKLKQTVLPAITKFNQTLLKSQKKRAIDDEVIAKKAEIDQNQVELKKKRCS